MKLTREQALAFKELVETALDKQWDEYTSSNQAYDGCLAFVVEEIARDISDDHCIRIKQSEKSRMYIDRDVGF